MSRGYLVFAPNFRGSTGRGKAYRQAVHTHGGDHDLRDAFLGMDRLAADGWVDPDRVGAFGGSTGGFFTTTAVTKDPERFKAGVVWYGSTDLVTLSTYGGMEGWNRYLIGKTPLENPENYYSRSIIYHAARVTTPLLFLYAQATRRPDSSRSSNTACKRSSRQLVRLGGLRRRAARLVSLAPGFGGEIAHGNGTDVRHLHPR